MSTKRFTSYAWLVVGLLWVVAMLNYLDRLTITTMRDSIKADIAMTDAQFGLLTSLFLWVYAFCSPLAGYLADRFSRTRVIVGSLFVWSLVTWLTGHCRTVEQLLAARALMGVSEACYIPAALALIADYHTGPTRSRATGIHMSGVYAGAALGGVGGYIAEYFSWRLGFTVFGVVGVVYALILAAVLRDAPKSEPAETLSAGPDRLRPLAALGALFGQGSYYVLLLHVSLLALAFWGINGWLPTYLKEHFNLGQGAAGLSATGYIQAASFVGILLGGYWADSWIRTNVRGRIYVPMIGFAVAAPALYMAASTDAMLFAILGLAVFGLARGFSDANMMPILCQVADPRTRATGYGIMNFFSCLVGGAMIYVGGALKDRQVDLGTIFQFAAIGMFAAAVLLLLIRPRQSESAEAEQLLEPAREA